MEEALAKNQHQKQAVEKQKKNLVTAFKMVTTPPKGKTMNGV